ncbi:MAG: S1 RNA-binding domain-containing protein [Anaerolineales bacterium]|nr:S1 RNA-binding domain-containing protein [Anaerolineales bacterium]
MSDRSSEGNQEDRDLGRAELARMIEASFDYTQPRRGEVYDSTVIAIRDKEIIVDLGVKRDGVVPESDLALLDRSLLDGLREGDHVPVCVLNLQGRDGEIVCSIHQGLQRKDWLDAQALQESGELVTAEVIDHNRGGVVVAFRQLRGFVPNSHLSSGGRRVQGPQLDQLRESLVGQQLHLVVIEVDQQRRRLVLSQRQAERHRREQLLDELEDGQVCTGTVCNLTDFGAFVDLGGMDGLVHISELDWAHVDHPAEVLQVGDEVQVVVLSVDRERGRVGLSRKRLLPDPWQRITASLRAGDLVTGTVTSVADFGVFVDVGDGVDGLAHHSRIPGGQALLTTLEPGMSATVRVLEISHQDRQIALELVDVGAAQNQAVADDQIEPL